MHAYPAHLGEAVEDASGRFPENASDFHTLIALVCRCGSRTFDLLVSDRKSVVAVCEACGSKTVVYDLAFYPAAIKMPGPESFTELSGMPTRPAKIFVQYEYGPREPDMEFDRNAITWCQIFSESEIGTLVKVFDDETA